MTVPNAMNQRNQFTHEIVSNSTITSICHSIDHENVASHIDQHCWEDESCSLPVKLYELWWCVAVIPKFDITADIKLLWYQVVGCLLGNVIAELLRGTWVRNNHWHCFLECSFLLTALWISSVCRPSWCPDLLSFCTFITIMWISSGIPTK